MRPRPRRRPLDGVNLLLVSLKVVHRALLRHGPNLEGHVVRAARQETPARAPLDGVHLVDVPHKGLHGTVTAELAHVDALVGRA